MASGGHNRKTAKELAASATERSDRLLASDNPGRDQLTYLLDAWEVVAKTAVAELTSEMSVTIVNAGDQVQKHPGVTVLEAASKRIEALVVLLDRFDEPDGSPGVGSAPEPLRVWKPGVVDGGK